MVIAIHVKIKKKNKVEENDNFIFEVFSRIIKRYSQHTFVLISETKLNNGLQSFKNVINVAAPNEKIPLLWYLWYNIKISRLLKKYKADVYVSYYGIASLFTKTPQCIFIDDLSFIHQSSAYKKSNLLFYKTFIPGSIKNATIIITVSEYCKTEIIKLYKTNADKIIVIYKGINKNFKEITYQEKEKVKAEYSDGNEYFVYTGEIGNHKNLMNLLKAFSAFKKRQKSSMQLLIAGKPCWKYEEFFESLRLFKFKEEVKIFKDPSLEDLIKITAASYAMVYPALYESFATQPLEAMCCGVPVIVSSTNALHEICADAALYVDAKNFKEIAVNMMHLFKDENLRKELIEKGKERAKKFNWEISSELVWENFRKVLS